MHEAATHVAPLGGLTLADDHDLDRQPQVADRTHQPNRLQRRVLDLGLDYQDIDVAAWRCRASRMRAEEHDASIRHLSRQTAPDLTDIRLVPSYQGARYLLVTMDERRAVSQEPRVSPCIGLGLMG
jgi:hypothetical protein